MPKAKKSYLSGLPVARSRRLWEHSLTPKNQAILREIVAEYFELRDAGEAPSKSQVMAVIGRELGAKPSENTFDRILQDFEDGR